MPSLVKALALGTAKDARTRTSEKDFFSRGVAVCRVISENFSSFVGALVSLPPSPARILVGAASRTTEVAAVGESEKGENNNTGEEDQICTAKPCERAKRQLLTKVHLGEVI